MTALTIATAVKDHAHGLHTVIRTKFTIRSSKLSTWPT